MALTNMGYSLSQMHRRAAMKLSRHLSMFMPMDWESQTPNHQALRDIASSTVLFAMIETHDAIAASP